MRFKAATLAIFLILLLPAKLRALTVDFAWHDHPRAQHWELLAVTLQVPPGGGTVSLQDARGGLIVSRPIAAGAGDASTAQATLLIPLPLLAAAELPSDAWPLNVAITSASGNVDRRRVDVARPGGGAASIGAAAQESFRILLANSQDRQGDASAGELPWENVNPAPAAFLNVSEDEVLSGPPLLLATCDALFISDHLAARLTADRIAALLNAGVQLASARDPAAATAKNMILNHLAWKTVAPSASTRALWITAHSSYPRPWVLEPEWGKSRPQRAQVAPARGTLVLVILVPITSLLIVLLARGMFRRRAIVFAAMAAGLAGWAWGAGEMLKSTAPPLIERAAWTSIAASGDATALSRDETFTSFNPLFAHHLQATAGPDSFLFPAALSARQYFSLKNAALLLDAPSDDGLQRLSRLEISLRPRETVVYALRSAALRPAHPDLLTPGQWIHAGYITPAPESAAAPILLTQWAVEHPALANSLLAWYELRFDPNHRYLLQTLAPDAITLTDFGESPATAP